MGRILQPVPGVFLGTHCLWLSLRDQRSLLVEAIFKPILHSSQLLERFQPLFVYPCRIHGRLPLP